MLTERPGSILLRAVIDSGGLKPTPFSDSSFDAHIPQSNLGEIQPVSDGQAAQLAAWVYMVEGWTVHCLPPARPVLGSGGVSAWVCPC